MDYIEYLDGFSKRHKDYKYLSKLFQNTINTIKTCDIINEDRSSMKIRIIRHIHSIFPDKENIDVFITALYNSYIDAKKDKTMPYKDETKRKEYHRDYCREYMRNHKELRDVCEKNRSNKVKEWKENGIILYKIRRLSKKYGALGVEVFLKDNCSCVKCGESDFRVLNVDHIIPKSKGGKNELDNLQTLCSNCHSLKHFSEDLHSNILLSTEQWDNYLMGFAKYIGKYSTCFSRQIGAVLTNCDNAIISVGWNGPAENIPLCDKRWELDSNLINMPDVVPKKGVCPRKLIGAKSSEMLDLCVAVHAEVSCILNALKIGKSTYGSTLYVNCSIPCKNCLLSIINAGVKRVVCNKLGSNTSNFGMFYDESSKYIYENSDISIDFIDI